MEPTVSTTSEQTEYPYLSDRVQSTFIDSILIIILMFAFGSILNKFEEDVPTWARIALFVGLWGIYEPLCTTLGATLGNFLKGIRVRKIGASSKRINFFQALIRYLLKITLGWISFLTIHSNKERRAIHDFAAGSVMVKI